MARISSWDGCLLRGLCDGFLRCLAMQHRDACARLQLVLSIDHDLFTTPAQADSDMTARRRALDALIGRTRAAVLHCVEDGCSTTELACRCGVSIASASQHASVLRDAGLLLTQRRGGSVLHSLTSLGAAVLTGHVTTLPPRPVNPQ